MGKGHWLLLLLHEETLRGQLALQQCRVLRAETSGRRNNDAGSLRNRKAKLAIGLKKEIVKAEILGKECSLLLLLLSRRKTSGCQRGWHGQGEKRRSHPSHTGIHGGPKSGGWITGKLWPYLTRW